MLSPVVNVHQKFTETTFISISLIPIPTDVVTLYESEIYEYCIVVRPDIGINEMDNKIISVNF